MKPRQTLVLLGKELVWGPKTFVFIMAVVMPLVLSLVISAIFGGLFSDLPRLGIYDEGDSRFVDRALDAVTLSAGEYSAVQEMVAAVESGVLDMGIILPYGFDEAISGGQTVEIEAYIWGESLAKDRTVLGVAIASIVRDISGSDLDLDITSVVIGDEKNVPWGERLLPLVVLMAVFIGGTMLPATSIITEKQKKTINAITVTPASAGDVIVSKALMGIIVSFAMGVLVLLINRTFGAHPGLLAGILFLGGVMAVEFGLLLGIYARDISTMFAAIKTMGILLYAPAFVYMFPQLPDWIGRVFPTYYVIQPVVAISQQGESWSGVALEVAILVLLVLAFGAVVAIKTRAIRERLA